MTVLFCFISAPIDDGAVQRLRDLIVSFAITLCSTLYSASTRALDQTLMLSIISISPHVLQVLCNSFITFCLSLQVNNSSHLSGRGCSLPKIAKLHLKVPLKTQINID